MSVNVVWSACGLKIKSTLPYVQSTHFGAFVRDDRHSNLPKKYKRPVPVRDLRLCRISWFNVYLRCKNN